MTPPPLAADWSTTPNMSDTARLAVFVHAPKGGVGKSFFSRGLLDYWRSAGSVAAAYDADAGTERTETLVQYYGQRDGQGRLLDVQDPMKGVFPFTLDEARERDLLVNLLDQTSASRIIIDLPGGAGHNMSQVLGGADRLFAAYLERGVQPVVVLVISHLKAAAAGVGATIEAFGMRPTYVVCKNLGCASADAFRVFHGYKRKGESRWGGGARALAAVNGIVVPMPALDPYTVGELDEHDLRFDEAEWSQRLESSADRIRVAQWRRDFAYALAGTIFEVPMNVAAAV